MNRWAWAFLVASLALHPVVAGAEAEAVTFDQDFEGGSLGRIERLGENSFRCHVEGQADENGRNRQASWYYFRMDHVRGRDLTLCLTNFVGEYNLTPGACAMNADTIPVWSEDGERWQHFPTMDWDDERKEARLRFRPERERIWIAHVPPYLPSRLNRLLGELAERPFVRVETIGRSVQGRDLHLVTMSEDTPGERSRTRKCIWVQARQHAWESPTSFVVEGAMRFLASDDPAARELRAKLVFKFMPMMDPDGCAGGKVRFNALGYDLNRHWDEVDPSRAEQRARMPEIWHTKKAILDWLGAGNDIALMLNLHNTETAEYLETQATAVTARELVGRFHELLVTKSSFDPPTAPRFSTGPTSTTNHLYAERGVTVVLMEQRIGSSPKLGRRPTVEDRLEFGRQLVKALAETVLAGG